jgi:hypothetical protein
MNKQEYKKQYRIARAAISSINRSVVSRGLSQDEAEAVWDLFWKGIYEKLPRVIYDAVQGPEQDRHSSHWGINSRSKMQCNYSHLPNSYPRTDVRNTGCV